MWWTGMNNQELMITIHGSNVSDLDPVIDTGLTLETSYAPPIPITCF